MRIFLNIALSIHKIHDNEKYMLYSCLFHLRSLGQRSVDKIMETEKPRSLVELNAYKLLERECCTFSLPTFYRGDTNTMQKGVKKTDETAYPWIRPTRYAIKARDKKQFLFTISANSIRKDNIFTTHV